MAWLFPDTWNIGDQPDDTDFEAISADDRTWGGAVDGGGYALTNCGGLRLNSGAPLTLDIASPVVPVQLRIGTDKVFALQPGVTIASALVINAINDAAAANVPLELRASQFLMFGGNVGIGMSTMPASLAGGLGILNGTAPSASPVGGVVAWAESGALKARGSSGTVTTMAPAEPHCPVCGSDFALEWQNKKYGHLILCVKCLASELGSRPWITMAT